MSHDLLLIASLAINLLRAVGGIGGFKFYRTATAVIMALAITHALPVIKFKSVAMVHSLSMPFFRVQAGEWKIKAFIERQLLFDNFVILPRLFTCQYFFADRLIYRLNVVWYIAP